jgi:HEAT repeat protein
VLHNSRSPEIADLVVAANLLGGGNHPAIRDSKWFAKLIAAGVGAATQIRGNRLAPKMWEFHSLAHNDPRVTRLKLLTWAIDNLKSRGEISDLIEVVNFGSLEGQRLAANAISDCTSLECVDALLLFLKRMAPGTDNLRRKIIKALGDIKSARSVSDLLEAIASWDYSTHKEAIQALGKIGGRDALHAIEEYLANPPSLHGAEAAAEVLCQTRDLRYLGLLLRNRRWVDSHWLSGWIMDALVKNGDSDKILELLSRGYVTVSAAKALITLGDFRGIQPILKILNLDAFPNADARVAFQPILETLVRSTLQQIPDKLLMDLVQLEDRVYQTLIGDIVISYSTERELARLELDRRRVTAQ